MANPPDDPTPPGGGTAQDTITSNAAPPVQEYQLPDCIIASSNRFNDIRPYCDSIYYADPKKWGDIMPWEYPYKPTHEQDATFLRKWFSETEIHMQGGAHGPGNGFRFLKQAWISIALWNWEKRMPSIADWWLQQEENQNILMDPGMMQHLLSASVTAETFFESSQIEMYGKKLLCLVIKQIQEIVKANNKAGQTPSAGESETKPNAQASSNDQDVGTAVASAVEQPPTIQGSQRNINAQRIVSPPTNTFAGSSGPTIPFPPYKEPPDTSRQTNAAYSQTPAEQPYGRKRGLSSSRRFSSGGGGRFHAPARQEWNPQDRNLSHNSSVTFDPVASNLNNFMSNRAQSQAFTAGGPPATGSLLPPLYMGPGLMNPDVTGSFAAQDHSRPQRMMRDSHQFEPRGAGMISDPGSMQILGGGVLDHRNFTNESALSGPDAYTSGFLHHRRSSQGSRGGGYRGQTRGGRGRGRGRGSFHEPTNPVETHALHRFSGDHSNAMNYNNRGRRSDASRAGWRSHSERPQEENVLPSRQFTFPNLSQHSGLPGSFQPVPGPSFGSQHQNTAQALSHHPPAAYPPSSVTPPVNDPGKGYMGITAKHIPEDARHVTGLVVFNIPRSEDIDVVRKTIADVCGVQINRISWLSKSQYHTGRDAYSQVYIDLPSHHAARGVLALGNDVKLYGKDLNAAVPRQFWDQSHGKFVQSQPNFGDPTVQSNHHARGFIQPDAADFVPGQASMPSPSPMQQQYGRYYDLSSIQDVRVDPGNTDYHVHSMHGEISPYHDMDQMMSLATVHSVSTTPTASSINTPKKKKNKNKTKVLRKDARTDPRTPLTQATIDTPQEAAQDGVLQTPETKDNGQQSSLEDNTPPTPTPARILSEASQYVQSFSSKLMASGRDSMSEESEVPHTPTSKTVKTKNLLARGQTDGAGSGTDEDHSLQSPSLSLPQHTAPAPTVSESEQADDSFHTARDTPPSGEGHESASAPTSSKKADDGKSQTTPGRSIEGKVATPTRPLRKPDITINVLSNTHDEVKAVKQVSEEKQSVKSIEQRSISGLSLLPTPAFHTAPTTPAPPVDAGDMSAQPILKENAPRSKPKAAAKQKGPAITESLSTFAKKKGGKKTKPTKLPNPATRQPSQVVVKTQQPTEISEGPPHVSVQTNKPELPVLGDEPVQETDTGTQEDVPLQTTQPTTPSSPTKRSLASYLRFIPGA